MTDSAPEPHTQELTILGLVALGKKYGFEMEEFIARTEMKRWNAIGNSTIYKLLKDLSAEGSLQVSKVSGGKGPPRNEYTLTEQGRAALRDHILAAIMSDRTAKVDRIVGLFFSPLLASQEAVPTLERLANHLTAAQQSLSVRESELENDVIGSAITGFYADLVAAEMKAVTKVLESVRD